MGRKHLPRKQKLASERKKGRVPMVVTAFNARSLKNKLASFKHALNKRKVDVCIINELNAPFTPAIREYSWFLAKDDRPFRGTAIYVHCTLQMGKAGDQGPRFRGGDGHGNDPSMDCHPINSPHP